MFREYVFLWLKIMILGNKNEKRYILIIGGNMKKNYKLLILFILLPIVFGGIVGFLTVRDSNIDSIIPAWIFPIVWTILYTLMGISSYRVYMISNKILSIYIIQLIINYSWVFIFFTLKNFILAFFVIILLIILVFIMIRKYLSIDKLSGYLQIPYFIWLFVALYLNKMFIM